MPRASASHPGHAKSILDSAGRRLRRGPTGATRVPALSPVPHVLVDTDSAAGVESKTA